jgi:hypothetical protein
VSRLRTTFNLNLHLFAVTLHLERHCTDQGCIKIQPLRRRRFKSPWYEEVAIKSIMGRDSVGLPSRQDASRPVRVK